ncbi:MAG TPA: response regulator, partial [Pseudomonadales bacterium]|nr:response regulator [Pseudomonadales bacterium]
TYVRKDQSRFPVLLSVSALRADDGKIFGYLGIGVDLTERKRNEEQLRNAIQSAPAAMMIVDEQGLISMANNEALKMFGYDAHALHGMRVEQLIPAQLRAKHTELRQQFNGSSNPRRLGTGRELYAENKTGEKFPVEISLSPVETSSGNHTLVMLVDITARKQQQTLLEQARRSAENASKLKSEFLANMSHEIRTPMNGIIGMTALALKTELTPRQREYLTMVQDSSQSLLRLINDILDFSKIEAGKLTLHAIHFDLRDLLGKTLQRIAPDAREKDLELLLMVAPDIPPLLYGDPDRLAQVIINLVSNAIKFTSSGEILVTASLLRKTEKEVELYCSVKDTGIGIGEESQARIFDAFSQADASTTRQFGGTGLGLSICKQIVNLMQGDIGVESAPGKGSTFYFSARFGQTNSQPSTPSATVCTRQKALIVDAHAIRQKILSDMLNYANVSVTCCTNASQAHAELFSTAQTDAAFDILLLHYPLPDADVLEWAAAHRSMLAENAAILLIGQQDADETNRQRAGIRAQLKHPIRFEELLQAVGSQTDTKNSSETALNLDEEYEPPLRFLKILLAEDHPVNQKLATSVLQQRGHRVKLVDNGRRALDLFQNEKFDVVVMDIQMPEMDGESCTAAIRRLEQGSARPIRIIAVTAHASAEDKTRLTQAGMADGFLAKPYLPEQLLEAVEGNPLVKRALSAQ